MRRKLPKFLDRYYLLPERAGHPRRGISKRVRMQQERKENAEHGRFLRMLKSGKSYTVEEFAEWLKSR